MTDMADSIRADREAALDDLDRLTECRCDQAYTDRGMHAPECEASSRDSVEVLRALLSENADLRERVKAADEVAEKVIKQSKEYGGISIAVRVAAIAYRATQKDGMQ